MTYLTPLLLQHFSDLTPQWITHRQLFCGCKFHQTLLR